MGSTPRSSPATTPNLMALGTRAATGGFRRSAEAVESPRDSCMTMAPERAPMAKRRATTLPMFMQAARRGCTRQTLQLLISASGSDPDRSRLLNSMA
jgi:hypothetical protein